MQTKRILGFDWIRLVSFAAIAFFHIAAIHFHSNTLTISERSSFIAGIETFARTLAFSGFTILLLTSVLTGMHGNSVKKRLRLFAYLFVGWLALCFLIKAPVSPLHTWDIYLLIFSGLFVAALVQGIGQRASRALALLGFVMCWIPIWQTGVFVGDYLGIPPLWQSVLGLADCSYSITEWPVLPWIGFIWFGYGAGLELKRLRMPGNDQNLAFTRQELATWGVILGVSIPNLGSFYDIGLVEFFRCDAYKQPPLVFWSHMAWPVFLMRAAVAPQVQSWLERWRLSHWVSGLAISRTFWLAYAVHYVLALLLSFLVNVARVPGTPYYDTVVIVIAIVFLPMIEFTIRALLALLAFAKTRLVKKAATLTPEQTSSET